MFLLIFLLYIVGKKKNYDFRKFVNKNLLFGIDYYLCLFFGSAYSTLVLWLAEVVSFLDVNERKQNKKLANDRKT